MSSEQTMKQEDQPEVDLIADYQAEMRNEDATNMLVWVTIIFCLFVLLTPLIGIYAAVIGVVILLVGVVMALVSMVRHMM